MSTPPVPPPNPNEPESEGKRPAPRYGENAPEYGQQNPATPQYGQNAPQYGQQNPATPQYGQNAPQGPGYGQQQFGQPYGQQQFGQPYGQSPYGQSPYGQFPSEQPQATGASGIPKLVDISFWLLIGAGILFVISTLMGIGQLDDPAMRNTFEEAIKNSGGGTAVSYDQMKGVIVGTLVVFAIIGVGLYALVAFFVRKGKNWARILGTVFAAISVLGLFGVPNIGTLGTLAGIAAIVLLYLPSAAPYFRRQQPFANPYGQPGNPYGTR
jgi:hypothetical protein